MIDETREPGAPESATIPPEETHKNGAANVYSGSSDPYGSEPETALVPGAAVAEQPETEASQEPPQVPPKRTPPPPPPPPPPDGDDDEGDEEERGMLRMSFMEHLEELRSRLLRSILGLAVAFILCIGFCKDLWEVVSAPAVEALRHLGVNPPNLAQITPMEQFNVIYLKLPLLVSIFVASPWILYQVWAFISPGLYKREKRWAVPFILCTAGLFITGGCFAYFIAFRYGLEFLLGIGRDVHVTPVVSINEYFDLFVNVTLGVGLVFEMPVLIFMLTLLRITTPAFLLNHSRYAILIIVIIAALVTPTPDVFNLMLFSAPMVLLYFIGVFASYLLVLRREKRRFPWGVVLTWVGILLALIAAGIAIGVWKFGLHIAPGWPFFKF